MDTLLYSVIERKLIFSHKNFTYSYSISTEPCCIHDYRTFLYLGMQVQQPVHHLPLATLWKYLTITYQIVVPAI